jgi:hypothetical protein
MEEYRQSLVESGDHPDDQNAAAMVKLQAILERMGHSSWHVKSDASRVSPPVVLIVNSIEEQLKQFRNEFFPALENNSQSNKSSQQFLLVNHADNICK